MRPPGLALSQDHAARVAAPTVFTHRFVPVLNEPRYTPAVLYGLCVLPPFFSLPLPSFPKFGGFGGMIDANTSAGGDGGDGGGFGGEGGEISPPAETISGFAVNIGDF